MYVLGMHVFFSVRFRSLSSGFRLKYRRILVTENLSTFVSAIFVREVVVDILFDRMFAAAFHLQSSEGKQNNDLK